MAKVDQYLVANGDYYDFLNVSAPVGGSNAVNHPSDVILVQGLFWYISPEHRGFPDTKAPEVSGAFDTLTRQAIETYQSYVKHRKSGLPRYNVIPDGRVSPAQGKFLFGRGAYIWTIQCLNEDAKQICKWEGGAENWTYIEEILESWPEIDAVLERDQATRVFLNALGPLP